MKRNVCLVLALCFVFLTSTVRFGFAAQTKEEIERELAEIEARIKAQEEKINTLRQEQKDQKSLLPALEQQIEEVEKKAGLIKAQAGGIERTVQALTTEIRSLETDITSLDGQMEICVLQSEEKRLQIERTQAELIERLRQQYMSGSVSNLQLLLSAPDVSTLLTFTEYISRQAQRDEERRRQLEEEMRQLAALQEQLEEQEQQQSQKKQTLQKQNTAQVKALLELKTEQTKLDSEHAKIGTAQKEIFGIIKKLDSKSAEAKRILEKERREQEAFERKLDELLQQQIDNGEIEKEIENSGIMIWPFPHSGCYISSPFGATSGRSHAHRGLDISIADKSKSYHIIAALDGVVSAHGYDKSMGYYVMIYHGLYEPKNKYIKTTYMHLKANSDVVDGEAIEQGKRIGIMGSTGNSTGPHLHFQINEFSDSTLKSSTPVNPLNYVSKP